MKKLLISGFEPFGGENLNPSWDALERLPDFVGNYALTKLRLPVVFGLAADKLISLVREQKPDAVICVGQAGGRASVTPELVAINLKYAKIADNEGNLPKDEPIIPNGRNAYFSTAPVRRICEAIAASGVPSEVSYSAGTYVCNEVLYRLLSELEGSGTPAVFIHVPYSKEQGKEPALSICDIVKALSVAIESLE